MSSTDEALTYKPLTAANLSDCVRVFQSAFSTDPHFPFFHPETPGDVLFEYDFQEFTKGFEGKDWRRWFCIWDEKKSKVAAFGKWHFPHAKEPAESEEKKYPPGTNVALMEEFFGSLKEGREKWIVDEDMYFMSLLAVDPAYQRKGLGRRLLEPVLEQADKEGRKIYIEASKKGVGLYERLGWERVGVMRIDLRPHGGDTVEETVLLIREPRKPS